MEGLTLIPFIKAAVAKCLKTKYPKTCKTATVTSTTTEIVPTTVLKYKKEVCSALVLGLMSAHWQ